MAKSLLSTGRRKRKPRSRVDPTMPIWANVDPSLNDYSKNKHYALAWLSGFSTKDLKDASIKYCKANRKDDMKMYRYTSIQPHYFLSVGKYCHIMNNGGSFAQDTLDWLEEKWSVLKDKAPVVVKEDKQSKPVVSIQDRIREKNNEYIAEIEEKIDLYVEAPWESDFQPYFFLQKNNVKAQSAMAIAEYYIPWRDELRETLKKRDPQLTETYSFMTTRQLQAFTDFLTLIITECTTWADNQKKVRKPRAKKPKSADKQIAKLKFQTKNDEFKLASVNPVTIIGATQLWVFNTKYRILTRYDASATGGLTVKGTTLQGYDEETSMSKKIRKPQDVLPRLEKGGKIVLRKLMDEINTKPITPNGRINSETILLRVIK